MPSETALTETTTPGADLHRLAAGLLDAWNQHDLERFLGYFSPAYLGIDVNDAFPQRGPGGLRDRATRYLEGFPDLCLSCETVLADRNQIALLWTARGTHRGPFMHIPPTQRGVEVRGVAVLTVEDGLIRHGLYVWDTAGLLRSLGLLPQL